MTQYMLSVHDVVGEDNAPTDPAELQKIYDDVDAFNAKVRAAGAWVFAGGLLPIDATTCVDNTTGQNLVTDEMVDRLEVLIDDTSARFDPPTEFVVPGQDRVSALLASTGLTDPMTSAVLPIQYEKFTAAWTHPGTYLTAIGVTVNGVAVLITPGPWSSGWGWRAA